ncbi:hypothetical protein pb186bvf_013689 [Paramecium bursaria]
MKRKLILTIQQYFVQFFIMLILQPSPYRFMFFMDKTLQRQVDKLYLPYKISHYCETAQIRQLVKESIHYVQELEYQNKEIQSLKNEVQSQINVINQKEAIINNIERNFGDQIQNIRSQFQDQISEQQNLIDQLTKENIKLKDKADRLEIINRDYCDRIIDFENKLHIAQSSLHLEVDNNKQYITQIETLKDIRCGSLIIKNQYREFNIIHQENKLYDWLLNKHKNLLFQYLDVQDINSLMLTSKFCYFIILSNRSIIGHIVKCRTKQLIHRIKYLELENSYFYDQAAVVPDEVVQISVAKFLAFKFKAGQYMNDIFNDVFDLIEGKINKPKQETLQIQSQQQQSQQQQPVTSSSSYESEDLIGLNDYQSSPTPTQIQQAEQQKSFGFLNKIRSTIEIKKPLQQPQQKQRTLAEFSLQIQLEFKEFDKLILDCLQVPFLRAQMIQTRKDMAEIVKRSEVITQQLFQAGQKCLQTASNPYPVNNMQDFVNQLQQTFARLVSNAHYLQLECQQLQQLCYYLTRQIIDFKKNNISLQSQIDDLKEEMNALRGMKSYLQDRSRQFENRIYENEDQILQLKKALQDQTKQNQSNQTVLQENSVKLTEQNEKIIKLTSALKILKVDRDNMETKLNDTYKNFHGLKEIFQRLE